MKTISTIFNIKNLWKVHGQISVLYDIKDESIKQRIFNTLMKYEGVSNTLDIRIEISKLVNNCLQNANYSDDESEDNKVIKILEELLY